MFQAFNQLISKSLILVVFLSLQFMQPLKAQIKTVDSASEANIDELMNTLKKDLKANKIWWNSWLGIYSAATIAQTGIALQTENKTLKQDMYLGAATTLLGAGAQLLTPYVKFDFGKFNSYNLLSEEAKNDLMNESYTYLESAAKYETEIRSWQNHAKCSVVNVASGLITWLAFDRTLKDGIINFAINSAITEAQIWTQPIRAKKEWSRISNLQKSGYYLYRHEPTATFYASAIPNGFQFKVVF